ncbi:replication initiation protein [Tortoise microvirus 35]|nr:replication initiation protein [Tortoise microvirus 35]
MRQEYKVSVNCWFITLTYNEDNVPIINGEKTLVRRHLQLFMKRLRDRIKPHKIRFFACGEYGSKTGRPHYHLILFNFFDDYEKVNSIVSDCWSLGFVLCKPVVSNHFHYVAKYCTDMDVGKRTSTRGQGRIPQFLLCSRRPAIGSGYLSTSMVNYYRNSLSIVARLDGKKYSLPKYYRDRLFDDDMKCSIRDKINQYRDSLVSVDTSVGETLRLDKLRYDSMNDDIRRFRKSFCKNSKL